MGMVAFFSDLEEEVEGENGPEKKISRYFPVFVFRKFAPCFVISARYHRRNHWRLRYCRETTEKIAVGFITDNQKIETRGRGSTNKCRAGKIVY